jgi:hypothetical protein
MESERMYGRGEQVGGNPIRNCPNKWRELVIFIDPQVFNQNLEFPSFRGQQLPDSQSNEMSTI